MKNVYLFRYDICSTYHTESIKISANLLSVTCLDLSRELFYLHFTPLESLKRFWSLKQAVFAISVKQSVKKQEFNWNFKKRQCNVPLIRAITLLDLVRELGACPTILLGCVTNIRLAILKNERSCYLSLLSFLLY